MDTPILQSWVQVVHPSFEPDVWYRVSLLRVEDQSHLQLLMSQFKDMKLPETEFYEHLGKFALSLCTECPLLLFQEPCGRVRTLYALTDWHILDSANLLGRSNTSNNRLFHIRLNSDLVPMEWIFENPHFQRFWDLTLRDLPRGKQDHTSFLPTSYADESVTHHILKDVVTDYYHTDKPAKVVLMHTPPMSPHGSDHPVAHDDHHNANITSKPGSQTSSETLDNDLERSRVTSQETLMDVPVDLPHFDSPIRERTLYQMPKKQVSFLDIEDEIKPILYKDKMEGVCAKFELGQVDENDTIRVGDDVRYSYEAFRTNEDSFGPKGVNPSTKDGNKWWDHVFKPSRHRSCEANGEMQDAEASPNATEAMAKAGRSKSRLRKRFSMSTIELSSQSTKSNSYLSKGVLVNLADPVHEDTQDIDDFIETGPRRHSVLYRTFESHSTLVLNRSLVNNTISAQDSDVGSESDIEILGTGVQRVALKGN